MERNTIDGSRQYVADNKFTCTQTLLHNKGLYHKNTLMPCEMSMGPLSAGVPLVGRLGAVLLHVEISLKWYVHAVYIKWYVHAVYILVV